MLLCQCESLEQSSRHTHSLLLDLLCTYFYLPLRIIYLFVFLEIVCSLTASCLFSLENLSTRKGDNNIVSMFYCILSIGKRFLTLFVDCLLPRGFTPYVEHSANIFILSSSCLPTNHAVVPHHSHDNGVLAFYVLPLFGLRVRPSFSPWLVCIGLLRVCVLTHQWLQPVFIVRRLCATCNFCLFVFVSFVCCSGPVVLYLLKLTLSLLHTNLLCVFRCFSLLLISLCSHLRSRFSEKSSCTYFDLLPSVLTASLLIRLSYVLYHTYHPLVHAVDLSYVSTVSLFFDSYTPRTLTPKYCSLFSVCW